MPGLPRRREEQGVWVPLAAILMVAIFAISTAIYFTHQVPRLQRRREAEQSEAVREDFLQLKTRLNALSTGEVVTVKVPRTGLVPGAAKVPTTTLTLIDSGGSVLRIFEYSSQRDFSRGWADENISYVDGGLKLDNFIGNRFTVRSWFNPHRDVAHELDEDPGERKISMRFTVQRPGTNTVQNAAVFGMVYQSDWYTDVDNYNIWIENDANGEPDGVTNGAMVTVSLTDDGQDRYQGQWIRASGLNATVQGGRTYHLLVQKAYSKETYFDLTLSSTAPFNTAWENHSRNENRGILTYGRNNSSDPMPVWTFERREPVYVLEYDDGRLEGNPYKTSFKIDWDGEYGYGKYKTFWQYYYGKVSKDRDGRYKLLWGENFAIAFEVTVNAIDMFVGRGQGTPDADLWVVFENADGVIESGRLARPVDVGGTPGWFRYNFSQSRTLSPGRYWVYLQSMAYYYNNYYSVPLENAENSGGTNPYGALTYGGTGSYAISSSDSGASWTAHLGIDIPFALVVENRYPTHGTYTSEVIDAGERVRWLNVGWDAVENLDPWVNARVENVWVRTGQLSSTVNPNWPDDPELGWSPWMPVGNGVEIADNEVARYFQFKVRLATDNVRHTPVVRSVRVCYISSMGVTLPEPSFKWVQTTTGDFRQFENDASEDELTENVSAAGDALRLGAAVGGVWENKENLPSLTYHGTDIIGINDNVFAIRGAYTTPVATWWTNDITSDARGWETLPDNPVGYQNGADMTWDQGDWIYHLCGGSYSSERFYFYRFRISTRTWQALKDTPSRQQAGASIVWVSTGTDNYVYIEFGGANESKTPNKEYHSTRFVRASTSAIDASPTGFAWEEMEPIPGHGFDDGGGLLWTGSDYIYAMKGAYSGTAKSEFWRYSISGDSWTRLKDLPEHTDDGGSMAWRPGDDFIYAMTGSNYVPGSDAFFRYSITGEQWYGKADLDLLRESVYGTDRAFYTKLDYSTNRWPLEVGKKYTVIETTWNLSRGEISEPKSRTLTVTVENLENVSVPAGTFECFKLKTTHPDAGLVELSYYSDAVKREVKIMKYATDELLQLVSYHVR